MNHDTTQAGFTVIELLVTLFVAAAFLTAGFMLYTYVLRDSGQARATTAASNIAYDYMRRYAGTIQNPCVASTPMVNVPVSAATLSNVTVSVTISCPPADTTSLSKVTVIVLYNSPQQTMEYSTYASL